MFSQPGLKKLSSLILAMALMSARALAQDTIITVPPPASQPTQPGQPGSEIVIGPRNGLQYPAGAPQTPANPTPTDPAIPGRIIIDGGLPSKPSAAAGRHPDFQDTRRARDAAGNENIRIAFRGTDAGVQSAGRDAGRFATCDQPADNGRRRRPPCRRYHQYDCDEQSARSW